MTLPINGCSKALPLLPVKDKSHENRIIQTICRIIDAIFDTLAAVLKTPARYFGSKNGEGYHRSIQKILTTEELKPFFKYGCACAYVHKTKEEWIAPFRYTIQSDNLKLEGLPPLLEVRENCLFDPKTLLKMAILQKGDEVIVAFGALGSAQTEGVEKSFLSKIEGAGAGSLLGGKPAIYTEADQVIAWLKKQPQFKDKQITLTGQCFGGSLATYCALKHGLKAVCLNPFPIGAGLQSELSSLRNADNLVTNICAKGDKYTNNPVVDAVDTVISAIGIKTPGTFGKRWAIPSAYTKSSETHNFILGSIMKHLGFDPKARIQDIPATFFS